jgi:hypothetical protein
MSFPELTDLVLNRLKISCREVTGIKQTFRLPPTLPVSQDDLPCAYTIPRGMTAPIPVNTAGSATVSRLYVVRVLVSPLTNGMDASNEGSQALADVVPYMDRFMAYFLEHPRLDTDGGIAVDGAVTESLRALSWLDEDVLYQDSGPVERPLGGVVYAALDISLTITMRGRLTPGRIS